MLRDSDRVTAATGFFFDDILGYVYASTYGRGVFRLPLPPANPSDFNQDDYNDVLWWNGGGDGGLEAWLLNGRTITATVTGGPAVSASSGWAPIRGGDFDADGWSDILWWNASAASISYWFMNGVNEAAIYENPVGGTWSVAGAGDFNGDGKTDVLFNDAQSQRAAVWLTTDRQHVFVGAPISYGSGGWAPVAVADFNDDGKADVLWQNSNGDFSIWYMNGAAVATFGHVFTGAQSPWNVVAARDFNGDGEPDILWRNAAAGQVAIWLMQNGSDHQSEASIRQWITPSGSVGAEWFVVGVADYALLPSPTSPDGRAEILWQSSSHTHAVTMWSFQGTDASTFDLASTAQVGNVPAGGWSVVPNF
jgi:hypothetical protein